jgi:hypothetical protein
MSKAKLESRNWKVDEDYGTGELSSLPNRVWHLTQMLSLA